MLGSQERLNRIKNAWGFRRAENKWAREAHTRSPKFLCALYSNGDIERERQDEIDQITKLPTPRNRAKRIDEYDDEIPGLDDKISEGMKILHSDEADD